ncbi:MAG: hypothetical protein CEE42_00505 [Promethearchaeota archaeon Loki_b31]|nr:MAG: hypothetical protein CEE42_00505 [Candidatus Lokiarchaeota archaeon Loki_b31]
MNKLRIKKKSVYFITLFLISGMIFLSSLNIQNQNLKKNYGYNSLNLSTIYEYEEQWLKNSNFSIPVDPWESQVQGDASDVNPISSFGQASYEIIGEQRSYSNISGTPLSSEWTKVHNPEFPLYPDTGTIEPYGCEVFHEYNEQADQFPSVHWDRNVTMPIDMSDYIITSASLSALVNATVTASPGASGGGGIEAPGDATGSGNTQNYTWDYVRFYILLSDLTKSKIYEVAYNQTVDLGKDSAGAYDYMTDTFMTTVSEEDLIFYLTSVLTSDNRNFTVTIGMRIWCEDNWLNDRDRWDSLLIKSCNLTFTYEKKIDRFTTASWNQIGNTLSGENIEITEGNLKFQYKIDQLWPVDSSPNSEIRFFINDNSLLETIKLSSADTIFQEAKTGGFDVTSLILKDVNISVSIQVFLADTFALNQNITISITDVYLEISYTEFIPDTEEAPWFFSGIFIIALVAAVALTGFLIAYIKVWRYPVPVRKIRKYNKTLTKEKGPDLKIVTRKTAFNMNYHDELKKTDKILKGTQMNGKILRDKLLDKKEGVLPK